MLFPVERSVNSFPIFRVDSGSHRTGRPMEWRPDVWTPAGESIGKQLRYYGAHGSALLPVDGLHLSKDRIINVERRSHDV